MLYFNEQEKIYIESFADQKIRAHEHKFLELVYVKRGSARHFMQGEEVIVTEGNYCLIDYHTAHSYEQVGSVPFEVINCLFLPEFIDKTLKHVQSFSAVMNNYLIHNSYNSIHINPANKIFFDENKIIYHLLLKIYEEYNAKNAGYIEIMRCLLIEMIIYIIREIRTQQSEHALLYNDVVKYIVDYVNDHYMEKITLQQIADQLCYSLPYTSKCFQLGYGISFETFLQRTRVEQACRLLANTDKKVIDIAECVGYHDSKFFVQVFKKFMNTTPTAYRNLYNNPHETLLPFKKDK